MARYTPEPDHAFLSLEAQTLFETHPEHLETYADAAELALDVATDTFDEEGATRVASAVALQISVLVARTPESVLLTSKGRGARSEAYRDTLPVDPMARQIVEGERKRLGLGGYTVANSARGRGSAVSIPNLPLDLNRRV